MMSDVEPDWSLDSCSYKELQRYAKQFNIRANQKAVKLRKDLAEHEEDIRELEGVAPKRRRLSAPEDGDGERWMGNVTMRGRASAEAEHVEVFSRETLLSISVEELLSGNGFFSPGGRASSGEAVGDPAAAKSSTPAAEQEPFNRTFDRGTPEPSPQRSKAAPLNATFSASDRASPRAKSSSGRRRRLNETFSESSGEDRGASEAHNETFSVDGGDDDMKENVAPAEGAMPSVVHPLGDALIRVEEDDQAFIIFDEAEVPSLAEKTFTKPANIELPLPKKRVEASRTPVTAALRKVNRQSAGSGVISKPKHLKTKLRMPDFSKIHQKAFDNMESVLDFNNRRKGILKSSTGHENKFISSLPSSSKFVTKNVDAPPRTVVPRTPQQLVTKRPDHSRITSSSISSRNKFDLKESLKKKPTWSMRKGPLSVGSTLATSQAR